ncbi:MAG: Unknown protein [uncultured Sulfurovum sp.]|uniref:Uncharacterized protein n=1 Tax=uncultured Sulfurovum sp. TaxID=269237 RepID=A0A6S6S8S7_9BACT|nr:MAG: Unknown protein [uncultured Sulfurovum sp.]
MKQITLLLSALLLFSACSESEKEKVIDTLQGIKVRDGENVLSITDLNDTLSETSGLAYVDGTLWAHNDSGGEAKLYAISENNGSILKTVTISNATNVDWEDLAFDETHLFIGDFGNNRGIRKNLSIYKVKLADLKTETTVEAEKIAFSYATQTDFTANSSTNYDCEAFIAYENNLYLFSKNYGNAQTDMYKLGMSSVEVAEKVSTFDTGALVTGASIDVSNKSLALIGYGASSTSEGNPKTWIFSEFTDTDFFKGKQEKISWGTPNIAQIEGVTHKEKGELYIGSEKLNYDNGLLSVTIKQKLYKLNY